MRGQASFDAIYFLRALDENRALTRHFVFILFTHRAPQQIRAAERVARQNLRDQHHLLLVHHHAEGGFEHRLEFRVEIPRVFAFAFDFLLAFALDEVIHHARAERPRAVQRHQGNHVLKAIGLEFFLQFLRAARLGLEHRGRIALREYLEYIRVIQRELIQLERRLIGMQLLQIHHRAFEHGQVTQPQKVKLNEADVLHVLFIVLADHVGGALRAIHRAKIGDFTRRDQYATRMHTDVARQSFERLGQFDNRLRLILAFHALFERRLLGQRARERPRIGRLMRNQFRQPVAITVRHVQNPPDVAHHRFCAKSTKRRNL